MAAPKDKKEKQGLTLDLDLKSDAAPGGKSKPQNDNPPEGSTKYGGTALQFRSLDVTVLKPSESKPRAPQSSKNKKFVPKTKAGKAQKSRSRLNPLAVIGGALVAGYFLSTYIGSMPSKAPVAPEAKRTPARESTQAVRTDKIPVQTTTDAPPVDVHSSIREAGFSQIGTEIDSKGNTYFAVRVKPKEVCHSGDVEAMRNVFGNSGSVLLSLEPMNEGNTKVQPVSKLISLKEISEGIKVSLPVDLKETGVYGIYICGDAAGSKRCGNKQPADFNSILNFQGLEEAANAVFFYQFSVIGLDYSTVYMGKPQGISAARDQLSSKKPKENWRPQLEKAAKMMRGVRSLPPETLVEGNTVVLELQVAMGSATGCR